MVYGVLEDVDEGYVTMISGVDYKSDDSEWLISINGSPLEIVLSTRKERWRRGSTI